MRVLRQHRRCVWSGWCGGRGVKRIAERVCACRVGNAAKAKLMLIKMQNLRDGVICRRCSLLSSRNRSTLTCGTRHRVLSLNIAPYRSTRTSVASFKYCLVVSGSMPGMSTRLTGCALLMSAKSAATCSSSDPGRKYLPPRPSQGGTHISARKKREKRNISSGATVAVVPIQQHNQTP